ncbi:HEPN domain-containing protein [Candidatus Woesearchaeota archaeon]|nr:HEPN domain-containing protein [Candidatus Woesearchaeota archaeon]
MKEYDLDKLLANQDLINKNIIKFLQKGILTNQDIDADEIKGHLLKSDHNLRFVAENIKLRFFDWVTIGCYYACYHAALALILTKGYSSKNHLATLCVLIREFYNRELSKKDLEILSNFIDYHDLLFYVEAKNKREDAAYSTKTKFDQNDTEQLRLKAILLVSKFKLVVGTAVKTVR